MSVPDPVSAGFSPAEEELGLDIAPGQLLVVGWAGPHGPRPLAVLHVVFDGGILADDVPIRLQEEELDEYRFVEPAALDDYLPWTEP